MYDLQFTIYGLEDNVRTFFLTSLVERDTELKKLLMVLFLGFIILKLETNIDEEAFDIQQMSSDIIDKWLKIFGWKQNIAIDKKRLLKTLISLWRLSGTDQGIKKAIEEFTGIKVAQIDEAWPKAYKNNLSLTDDQKRNVTVYLSNYPLGEQTLTYVSLAQQIVNLFKPVHAVVTVQVLQNIISNYAGKTISSVAGRTINDVTYTPIS